MNNLLCNHKHRLFGCLQTTKNALALKALLKDLSAKAKFEVGELQRFQDSDLQRVDLLFEPEKQDEMNLPR